MTYPMKELLRQSPELWDLFVFKTEPIHNQAYADLSDTLSDRLFLEPFLSRYLAKNGLRIDYPDDRPFAVCLTHDVDDVYPPVHERALSALYSAGHLDIRDAARQLFWEAGGPAHSPYMNFGEIMRLEEEYGARSSFYFLATDRDVRRFRYDVEDLGGPMGEIVDRGFEVGLHGGYYSYADPGAIGDEKKRLERVLNRRVVGYRNHYLKFRIPETWEYLANAGFRYDATIGNNRVIGFKNGLCHPFKPFDVRTGREIDIIELPMVLADFTLMTAKLNPRRIWEVAKSLIDGVEASGGVATLLWHNDVFGCSFRKDWVRVYRKVLAYCREKNAWMTSGDHIAEWVRKAY